MLRTLLIGIESLLFPASCPACGTAVEEVRRCPLCPPCAGRITPPAPPWCGRCGKSLAGLGAGVTVCAACRVKKSFPVDQAVSAAAYETPVKELVACLKYEGKLSVAPFLAELLTREIRRHLGEDPADLIVPVPLHPVRLRERSFNQSVILAQQLAWKTGLPCFNKGLIRRRPTRPQTELSALQRRGNMRGAFALGTIPRLQSARVLLIDDVFTTGATAEACARVLKEAGAGRVVLASVARQDASPEK